MASRLLLIGCIALMLFTAHVQSLKCVVCGTPDITKGKIELGCPDKLPDPIDCKDAEGGKVIDYKFCTKIENKGDKTYVIRGCSALENNVCNAGACSYSCNTDGCNAANISSANENLLTMLMCVVAFVGLVGFKKA